MPWCPRCDETFPEGPACPRCSARLISRERDTAEDTLQAVPALRALRVSRRYRRALEKLSGPKAPSSRALVAALTLIVFASGFMLGRVGTMTGGQPTVRALPLAEPLPFDEKGAVSYIVSSRDPLITIAFHDLFSGDVSPQARFSPPVEPTSHVTTRVVSYGRSVAVVLSDGVHSYVAFAPHGRAQQGWVPGEQAAWNSEKELLIRHVDGQVVRWTTETDNVTTRVVYPSSSELLQTPAGAVVRRGRTLEVAYGPRRTLTLPSDGSVSAVSPDTTHALLDRGSPMLWDGKNAVRIPTAAGKVLGASFEPAGDHLAILLEENGELTLAVVDLHGDAALKPLGRASACSSTPAWDALGSWVYVATGDGVLHAIEANGGRIESVRTSGVGCGVAWIDIA